MDLKYVQFEPEGQFLDRKRANIKPIQVAEHISAFANAEGGTLVIGIEDDGEVTGFKMGNTKKIEEYIEAPMDFLSRLPKYSYERMPVKNAKGEADEVLIFTIEPNYSAMVGLKNEQVYL